MRKNTNPQSGFFNPRIFATFILCSFGVWLAMLSFAATPDNYTIDETHTSITYTAGPFLQANQSPVGLGQLDSGPRCDSTAFPCDTFHLTTVLTQNFIDTHPTAAIKVSLTWVDTGTGQSDYDLYIYRLPRADCASSTP